MPAAAVIRRIRALSGFIGFKGLSLIHILELFNKGYWETMDVKEVLKKSFEKTTQVINSSMG